jgi:hypothetical protein
MGVFIVIFGLCKVVQPDGQQPLVGQDLSISLVFFIILNAFFIGIAMYIQVIVKFLRSYSIMMTRESGDKLINRLNYISFVSSYLLLAVLITSIIPLISIPYPSQSIEIVTAFLCTLAVEGGLVGLICLNFLTFLIKELNIYIESVEANLSKDIRTVVYRLNIAYMIGCWTTFLYVSILLISVSSSLVLHASSYLLLFIYIATTPWTFYLVVTVSRVSLQEDDNQFDNSVSHDTSVTNRTIRSLLGKYFGRKIIPDISG